jgi:Zn-dependent M28 family amino/carboxypeptidase
LILARCAASVYALTQNRSRGGSVSVLNSFVGRLLACVAFAQVMASSASAGPAAPVDVAGRAITAEGVLGHIKILASDEFEGRLPGTHGGDLAVAYITAQFKKLGLAPGNPDGSYVQAVALDGVRGTSAGSFSAGGHTITLAFPQDAVARTQRFVPAVEVKDSEMIFVGYGVVAPEYHWDDYKGVDVRGKTIIMLINDPPVVDPRNPSKLDELMFKGRAMTYYGRWTYKYEIASEKGAAAAIIIHQTAPAAYPWEVVQNSWGGEKFDTAAPDKHMDRVAIQSWITLAKARELFADSGLDFDAQFKSAARADFKPVALHAKANLRVTNTLRQLTSYNVVARLEGADVKRRHQFVIYTAHWDHFGRNPNLTGDQIFHGAADNASGVAGVLEIAKAFSKLPAPPARSILFMSVTGEEQGLLGSQWYAAHPLYPLDHTVAEINMDVLNLWGRTRDLTIVGLGQSTLEDTLGELARAHGRVVLADKEPEKGGYFRSDHFEFAKVGVPAINYGGGYNYIGRPANWGMQKHDEFTAHDYHRPTDVVKPDWDLAGAVEDLRLMMELGYTVAQARDYPQWKSGSEFKARRDAMMGASH